MTNDVKKHALVERCRTLFLAATMVSTLSLAACGNGNSSGNLGDTSAKMAHLPDDPENEPAAQMPSTSEKASVPAMTTPNPSENDRAAILQKYNYVDPQHLVATQALEDALIYFDQNKAKIKNINYVSVINFAQNAREKRFYIIDMNSGSVWAIHVAHGKGSDPDYDGYAQTFSNVSGSNASSLGFYMTAETYSGEHGLSLRLDGLSSTNSNARSRAIVLHGADYVQEANVIAGRSWGCPAIAMENRDIVVPALKNGSLIYAVVDKGGNGGRTTTPTPTPTVTPSPVPTASPAPTVAPSPAPDSGSNYKMYSLSWESNSHPERAQWSAYLQQIILQNWSSLLKGASDMNSFCPTYSSLNNSERANVWAELIVAMTRYESDYSPTSRMLESTLGTDAITGKPVYSEGLLQLSYGDMQGYSFCKFDWSKDKNLSPTDPKKTILDPYINLYCGVGILAHQVANKNTIAINSGAYWAVIKPNNKYQKLSSIQSMVKALPLCQN